MQVCRTRVHSWGRSNRVSFDPGKEHMVVLHPIHGEGEAFKLLGLMVDCKLNMQDAVDKILSQAKPKITAILKIQHFYDTRQLIAQFKTHIWGIIENNTGGLFHASNTVLKKLDALQSKFLREIGID